MNISQMQYDGASASFNNIAEQSGQAQLQSAQAQMNSQQQMYSGFRDFVSGVWGEITDNVNIAGQMQLESNQIQVEGQKQVFSGLKDFTTEIWNGITDTANMAGQMQVQNTAPGNTSSNLLSPNLSRYNQTSSSHYLPATDRHNNPFSPRQHNAR